MREALESLIAQMVDKGILFEEAATEFERRFIERVLGQSGGNQTLAARRLGMHRNTLCRKIADLKIGANGHIAAPRPPVGEKSPVRRSHAGAPHARTAKTRAR